MNYELITDFNRNTENVWVIYTNLGSYIINEIHFQLFHLKMHGGGLIFLHPPSPHNLISMNPPAPLSHILATPCPHNLNFKDCLHKPHFLVILMYYSNYSSVGHFDCICHLGFVMQKSGLVLNIVKENKTTMTLQKWGSNLLSNIKDVYCA